jgi:hypothetical protein
MSSTHRKNKRKSNDPTTRAVQLAKEAGKGVLKESGKIAGGVLSELFRIITLQK